MADKNPWEYFSSHAIASACGANQAHVEDNWPHIHWALSELGISSKLIQAAAIGTVGVETASRFESIEEYRNADGSEPWYWKNYHGGSLYHGRGFIQLTHVENYAHFGAEPNIKVDLVKHPQRALEPSISAWMLAYFFLERHVAASAAEGNWYNVRHYVQGGTPPAGLQHFISIVHALGV